MSFGCQLSYKIQPKVMVICGLILAVCIITLSSNQMVEAQPSVTISAFADDTPFNEFETISTDADIRFDFTASESSTFVCNVYIIDFDLQDNMFKRLLKTNDCGSGTSGSITYNDIALSQNQLQFNVLARGNSPIIGNQTFTFFVTGGFAPGGTTGTTPGGTTGTTPSGNIITLSSNQMVEAQPSIAISAFADNVQFNEFDALAPDSVIRFDFTASESSDFICNVYIIDIDLQENMFKRLLKTNDCGSGTSGSITYNDIALSQNQLQFNVLAHGNSPIIGNQTITFFIVGGAFTPGEITPGGACKK